MLSLGLAYTFNDLNGCYDEATAETAKCLSTPALDIAFWLIVVLTLIVPIVVGALLDLYYFRNSQQKRPKGIKVQLCPF